MKKSLSCGSAAVVMVLSVASYGEIVPQLPPSEYVDTEVSTNWPLVHGAIASLNLCLAFVGTPSNNVEVALGEAVNRDGEFAYGECDLRFGWDCGRYFIERIATGERLDEDVVGTNEMERVLEWRSAVRRHRLEGLTVTNEVGAAFLSVTTNPPAWLYDDRWNFFRVTVRGVDASNECLRYELTRRGMSIIVR